MAQLTENRPRGRPRRVDVSELTTYEEAWVSIFCGLRNGVPETGGQVRIASGMFIKARPDRDKLYTTITNETIEEGGREKLSVVLPGGTQYAIHQPKFIETPEEMQDWHERARKFEEDFEQGMMSGVPIRTFVPAYPAEHHIWQALKQARTAAHVRRAYNRSKIWLISRREFPSGGYFDWSWHAVPRALYRHAEQFCRAKLDRRYPGRDQRESGDYRRIEYLARVMAGLSLFPPISPSYSIEVLRKLEHLGQCECWRCTRKIAPRYKRSLAQYLQETKGNL